MNAIAAPKSSALNRLEGFALTAILQGFPTFAATALLLKLARHDITGGPVLLVVTASVLHGLFTPWLAPKFPKFFRHGYEPLFFNAGLSFRDGGDRFAPPLTSLSAPRGEGGKAKRSPLCGASLRLISCFEPAGSKR